MTKILVVRLSSLGDVLLATPLLRALVEQIPLAKIDFVVKEHYAEALKYNPRINQLFSVDSSYNYLSGLSPELKNYQLIIDLQNNIRSRRLLKGGYKPLRFRKKSFNKFLAVKFKFIKYLPQLPVAERYIESVPGLRADSKGCEFYFPPDYPPTSEKLNEKIIGLCPGSRHFTKQWPTEYYSALALLLIKAGYRVFIIGGADDEAAGRLIKDAVPAVENLTGENKLFKIGSAMQNCCAIVCNDSGLMHFATALAVPVASIFGSTIQEFGFSPYNCKSVLIENNSLSCRPCSHIGRAECPQKHFKCMMELSPEFVFKKVVALAGV